jgi:hypothetical protein
MTQNESKHKENFLYDVLFRYLRDFTLVAAGGIMGSLFRQVEGDFAWNVGYLIVALVVAMSLFFDIARRYGMAILTSRPNGENPKS